MIDGKAVLAIVPARGGSKGLPGKNIINLMGKPMLGWPIEAARNSQYIDKIIVSTDDQKIADVAAEQGAEVPFIRPADLATDDATTISVIEHALEYLKTRGDEFDYVVLLEPTSPLTETSDINFALEKLLKNQDIADSIVGVSKIESTHPAFDVYVDEYEKIQPYIGSGFSSTLRRQELSDLYYCEGSLYISTIQSLLKQKGFYHERALAYKVPRWKAFEVDDLVDFYCVEAIMKNLNHIKVKEK